MTQPVAVVEVCCTLPGGGLLLLYTTPALLEVCCRCSECTAHFPPRADETSAYTVPNKGDGMKTIVSAHKMTHVAEQFFSLHVPLLAEFDTKSL